jgi:hypothetical protein
MLAEFFGGKSLRNRPLEIPRGKFEDSIKMDIRKICVVMRGGWN